MYGMETAFFRYATKNNTESEKIFSTSLFSLLATTSLFVLGLGLMSSKIAELIHYPEKGHIVLMLALIIGLDTLANIPFAKLRLEGKPLKYVMIKAINVVAFVLLNVLLLYPLLTQDSYTLMGYTINKSNGVAMVFVANLLASGITFLFFIPMLLKQQWSFCRKTWNEMMRYGLPFIIVGLAGIVNETLDRVLLKYLLPYDNQGERMAQIGIYSAAYKLSIFMNLIVQAFKMGAEPFFFKQAGEKDAKEVYADVMKYFVILSLVVFLGVSFNLDWLMLVMGANYQAGKMVVPIVLMAYLFLGIYYNLSVWYKLTDKTLYATVISIAGALVTIIINVIFIPKIGYFASAWATLLAYFTMVVISWAWGKRFYPVAYPFLRLFLYLALAVGLYLLSIIISIDTLWLKLLINNSLLILFLAIAYYFDVYKFFKSKQTSV